MKYFGCNFSDSFWYWWIRGWGWSEQQWMLVLRLGWSNFVFTYYCITAFLHVLLKGYFPVPLVPKQMSNMNISVFCCLLRSALFCRHYLLSCFYLSGFSFLYVCMKFCLTCAYKCNLCRESKPNRNKPKYNC